MKTKDVIAQVGTFDVENYGDLLFPYILKNQLCEFEVDLFSPNGGKKPFEEETTVHPISKLFEMAQKKQYKAIIIGGGDLIRIDDRIASEYNINIENSLTIWQYPIFVGKTLGIPVIFNALGVPFYFCNYHRSLVKFIVEQVDYIAVRDHTSETALLLCGINRVKVVPDTVLCIDQFINIEKLKKIKKEVLGKKNLVNLDKYIIFQHNQSSMNDERYVEQLKKVVQKIISFGYQVLFLPIGYVHGDSHFMKKVYDVEDSNQIFMEGKLSPLEMLSFIATSQGYIGTSMHGAITAFVYHVPIMVLNSIDMMKINGLMQNLGLESANIKKIEKAFPYIEKYFFSQCQTKLSSLKQEIEEHFFKIKNVIKDYKKEPQTFYENKLIAYCFQQFGQLRESQAMCDMINVYYDYGNGYTEKDKTIYINSCQEQKVKLQLKLEKGIRAIRIDPIEGYAIKYKNVNIIGEDEKIQYTINNAFHSEESVYSLTLDPQIIIAFSKEHTFLKVEFEYSILTCIDLLHLIQLLNQKLEDNTILTKKYEGRLKEIENNKYWKTYQRFRKMIKHN